MKIIPIIVGATTILLTLNAIAAEYVILAQPGYRSERPVIYKSLSAAQKKNRLGGCMLVIGMTVKLIKYGPRFSKVATVPIGNSTCEGYVKSTFVNRR